MPVRLKKDSSGPYYQWGDHGAKYYFVPSSRQSQLIAKNRAERQGKAVKVSQTRSSVPQNIKHVVKVLKTGPKPKIAYTRPVPAQATAGTDIQNYLRAVERGERDELLKRQTELTKVKERAAAEYEDRWRQLQLKKDAEIAALQGNLAAQLANIHAQAAPPAAPVPPPELEPVRVGLQQYDLAELQRINAEREEEERKQRELEEKRAAAEVSVKAKEKEFVDIENKLSYILGYIDNVDDGAFRQRFVDALDLPASLRDSSGEDMIKHVFNHPYSEERLNYLRSILPSVPFTNKADDIAHLAYGAVKKVERHFAPITSKEAIGTGIRGLHIDPKEGISNIAIEDFMAPMRKYGFQGVFMADEIAKELLRRDLPIRGSFIMNLDKESQPGSHWVAIYWDLSHKHDHGYSVSFPTDGETYQGVYYYDSFGRAPSDSFLRQLKQITDHLQDKFDIDYEIYFNYNHCQQQDLDSVECGLFAMGWLLFMYAGFNPAEQCCCYHDEDAAP